MRITGYILIGIGVVVMAYVIVNHLVFDVAPIEQAGTENAAPQHTGIFWLALIPATLSMLVGGWMAFSRDRGYKVTYDTTRQQS